VESSDVIEYGMGKGRWEGDGQDVKLEGGSLFGKELDELEGEYSR